MTAEQFYPEQLAVFTPDSICAKRLFTFSPHTSEHEGEKVLAIDIGGDKIESGVFRVENGKMKKINEGNVFSSSAGKGYVSFLEREAEYAQEKSFPVGISSAGIIEDNTLLVTANMPTFKQELTEKYAGRFDTVFSDSFRSVASDSIMGLLAGSAEAKRQDPVSENVLFVINGSGIGGAVLRDNEVWSIQPGHLPVIEQLNPYGQQDLCHNSYTLCHPGEGRDPEAPKGKAWIPGLPPGMTDYVCIEKVAGGKAGVESIYAQKTGEKLSGKEISAKAQQGDVLATGILDNSARAVSHMVIGVGNAIDLLEEGKKLAVVSHGGMFKSSEYAEKVEKQIKDEYNNIVFIYTKDFTDNACLEGAAIAGLEN